MLWSVMQMPAFDVICLLPFPVFIAVFERDVLSQSRHTHTHTVTRITEQLALCYMDPSDGTEVIRCGSKNHTHCVTLPAQQPVTSPAQQPVVSTKHFGFILCQTWGSLKQVRSH